MGPIAAGVFSLLAFASLPLVPLLGAFFALLTPLPLVHLVASGRTSALGWGWVVVALTGAALTWQAPWLAAASLGYLLLGAWPALAIEWWLRRPWRTGRWTALITLVALAALMLSLLAAFSPEAPAAGLEAVLAGTTSEAMEMMRQLGTAGAGGEELLSRAMHLAAYLLPSVGALYILMSALWLRPRLPLLGLERGGEPFHSYSSEDWLPVGFALGGIGWVYAGGELKWLATNLFVTVLGLYFVHGLAIIHFYLGRRFGGNRWVRLAVALFTLQIPVAVVLSALGLADTFVALRRGHQWDEGSEA
ncbi:MAG: DUF2232 domain-containing protein [Acidobacteriota bacterium]